MNFKFWSKNPKRRETSWWSWHRHEDKIKDNSKEARFVSTACLPQVQYRDQWRGPIKAVKNIPVP
jgi:hypothetical protein